MQPPDLQVKVVAKVAGLWKLALLTFLLRHVSKRHIVHVHVNNGLRTQCIVSLNETPSLTGQKPEQASHAS